MIFLGVVLRHSSSGMINALIPISDQNRNSLYNISTIPSGKMMNEEKHLFIGD